VTKLSHLRNKFIQILLSYEEKKCLVVELVGLKYEVLAKLRGGGRSAAQNGLVFSPNKEYPSTFLHK